MKKRSIVFILLLLAAFTRIQAQVNKELAAYAEKEKTLLLKAYAMKDIPGYLKILNEFESRYGNYSAKDKEDLRWELNEEYYLLADMYSLAGMKAEALDYLEESGNHDYCYLRRDHDLDNIRHEPRFVIFLKEAPKCSDIIMLPRNKIKATSDFTEMMEKFKKFYNHEQPDSIGNMLVKEVKPRFTPQLLEELKADYGEMVSYKYMAQDTGDNNNIIVALFKVTFEKTTNVLGFSLDKNNKIDKFRFETSSEFIDKLLAKEP